MKTKDSKETFRAFLTMVTKKNRPTKIWVDKGAEFAGEFKNFAKLKQYKFTRQSVRLRLHLLNVERTIRSLKNILYRYMEDYGYKYIHKLSQVVTTLNSGKNARCLIPKMSRIPTFCPFCTPSQYENLKNEFKIGDRVRISKSD